jgi:hypothetical protein
MLMDVITTTATVLPTALPTVLPAVTASATAIPLGPEQQQLVSLAQRMVTDAALISTALFSGIEAFDRRVFPLPGWFKAFVSWALSVVLPYFWYVYQALQGVVPFDCYTLLLMSSMVKVGAEGLHTATDKVEEMPFVQALIERWRARRRPKKSARKPRSSGGPGGADGAGGTDPRV